VAILVLLESACSLLIPTSGLSDGDPDVSGADPGHVGALEAKAPADTADAASGSAAIDGATSLPDTHASTPDASSDAPKLPLGATCVSAQDCADGACVSFGFLPHDSDRQCTAPCPADHSQCPNEGRGCDLRGYCKVR
jgi:hypothetical protein